MTKPVPRAIGTVGRMWADNMPDKFVDSLTNLMSYSHRTLCGPDEYIHYDYAKCSWHELGRNNLVEGMRGDWLLQLDTDHVFSPDLLTRLLRLADRHGADVISGIYQTKYPPHEPVMGLWTPEGKLAPIVDWPRHAEVIPVGACGAGCLLVRRSVFTRIRTELNELPFSIHPGLSEDYSFCWRCARLGIPVYVAPNVEAHHIIRSALSVKDYVGQEGIPYSSGDGHLSL